jgi:hypothetical protein
VRLVRHDQSNSHSLDYLVAGSSSERESTAAVPRDVPIDLEQISLDDGCGFLPIEGCLWACWGEGASLPARRS